MSLPMRLKSTISRMTPQGYAVLLLSLYSSYDFGTPQSASSATCLIIVVIKIIIVVVVAVIIIIKRRVVWHHSTAEAKGNGAAKCT